MLKLYEEPTEPDHTLIYEHASINDFALRSQHPHAIQIRKNINELCRDFSEDPVVNNHLRSMIKSVNDLNYLSAYTELLASRFFTDLGYEVKILDQNKGAGIPDLVCAKQDQHIYAEVTSLHTLSGISRFEKQLYNKVNINFKAKEHTRSVILKGNVNAQLPNIRQRRIIARLRDLLNHYNRIDKKRTNSFGLPRHTLYCEHKRNCEHCTKFKYTDYHTCESCHYLNCSLVPNHDFTSDVPILKFYPLNNNRSPIYERITKRLRDKSKSQYPTIPDERPYIIVMGLYDDICLNDDLDMLRGLYGYDRVNKHGLIPNSKDKFSTVPGRWLCREGHYIHPSTAGVLVFNNPYPHLTDINYTFYVNPGNADDILSYPDFDSLDIKYINEDKFRLIHRPGFNFSLDVI